MPGSRVWWGVAAVLLLGASCFMLVGAVFCAGTLHVAKIGSIAPAGTQTVDLEAADHARLSAWWLRPLSPNGNCVMVLHGIKDSRVSTVEFAPMFLSEGYSVLVPDSRAHGTSGGAFVTYGLLEKYDTIGWAHWLRNQGCVKIYGLGESLGASVLIQAAALEPTFAAVVAECPYADLRELAEYRVRIMLRAPNFIAAPIAKLTVSSGLFYARVADGLDLRGVSPLESIAGASTPILLIHGLSDQRTPPSHSRRLLAAAPRSVLWLVPGADHVHASKVEPAEFRRRVLDWFSRN